MNKCVFNGEINGQKFDNRDEFMKVFNNTKREDLQSYSFSESRTEETSDDSKVSTDVSEVLPQNVFDIFGIKGSVFDYIDKIFDDYTKRLVAHRETTLTEAKPTVHIDLPEFDLDAFNGDDEHDEEIIDTISKKLYELQEVFKSLSVDEARAALQKVTNALNTLADKRKITETKMGEIEARQDEINTHIDKLSADIDSLCDEYDSLTEKYDILESAYDALALYEDFHDKLVQFLDEK